MRWRLILPTPRRAPGILHFSGSPQTVEVTVAVPVAGPMGALGPARVRARAGAEHLEEGRPEEEHAAGNAEELSPDGSRAGGRAGSCAGLQRPSLHARNSADQRIQLGQKARLSQKAQPTRLFTLIGRLSSQLPAPQPALRLLR